MKHLILVVLLLTSCLTGKSLTTVSYRIAKEYPKYYMEVPKGYKFQGGEVTVERESFYIYNDSSFIYVTNFGDIPNYDNIKSLGDSIFHFRFQSEKLTIAVNEAIGENKFPLWPDKTELSGLNSKSLFWKDIKIGPISIGYNNVPIEKKALFDKCLRTLRVQHGLITKKLLM